MLGSIFLQILLLGLSFLVIFSSICLKHANADIGKTNEFDIVL